MHSYQYHILIFHGQLVWKWTHLTPSNPDVIISYYKWDSHEILTAYNNIIYFWNIIHLQFPFISEYLMIFCWFCFLWCFVSLLSLTFSDVTTNLYVIIHHYCVCPDCNVFPEWCATSSWPKFVIKWKTKHNILQCPHISKYSIK